MNEPKYKVKQWVRFYKDGRLTIGVIEYIVRDPGYGEFKYATDIGEVAEHFILESR